LARERLDVLTQSLLEPVQTIDFVFGSAARFGDDLSGSLLGAGRHLARLVLGLLLGLFDELLGHHDHRSHLFGAGDADVARRRRRGRGAHRDITRRTSVELIDPLTSLAQLLALLLDQFFELVDLAREAFEEVIDLVDVVSPNPDFEGHRINGVQR
jgi:hypothetical protein